MLVKKCVQSVIVVIVIIVVIVVIVVIHHYHIDHSAPCLPPPPPKKKNKQKRCITIVFVFSWDDRNTQEKMEAMVMQNFGGQTRCLCENGELWSFWSLWSL